MKKEHSVPPDIEVSLDQLDAVTEKLELEIDAFIKKHAPLFRSLQLYQALGNLIAKQVQMPSRTLEIRDLSTKAVDLSNAVIELFTQMESLAKSCKTLDQQMGIWNHLDTWVKKQARNAGPIADPHVLKFVTDRQRSRAPQRSTSQ